MVTIVWAACAWTAFAPVVARAQQAGAVDPFAGVEEMVVVGSGTAALLAPTSTSAISFDTAELEAKGVADLSDLSAYVPNLEIRSSNATNASFFVRGVGLQDFGANASSSVPIFQDGVVRNPSASQLVGLFDVAGLSVLRGPQGSGNRRNSSAGAFIIQTTKPEPEVSGYANVSLARIVSVDARDGNKYDFEAAITAPVYDDIVSMRVAARYTRESPWFENGCANRRPLETRPERPQAPSQEPFVDFQLCNETVRPAEISDVTPFLSRYLGEVDDFGFRGSIRLQPPDSSADFTMRVELTRLNRDSTLGQVFGTASPAPQGVPRTGRISGTDSQEYRDPDIDRRVVALEEQFRTEITNRINADPTLTDAEKRRAIRQATTDRELGILAEPIVADELFARPLDEHPYRGDFDTPGRTINETQSVSLEGTIEYDHFDLKVTGGFIDYRKSEARDTDLGPNVTFPSINNDEAWETYAALDFTGEEIGDFPIEWEAGLYNIIQQVEFFQRQDINLFENPLDTNFQEEIYGFGLYGQFSYEFFEAFTLAAGVRYNWERKDFEVSNSRVQGGTSILQQSRNQRTWDAFTGFAELRYAFTEDVEAYLKYSRGFKAGHFNPSRPDEARNPDLGFADPEQIDAFEWGVNYAFWAGRVSGQTSFFFYNYKNYQVFRLTSTFQGVFRVIQNAQQARNFGAEVGFKITPLEGFVPEAIERLRINIDFGWLETNFVEFTNTEEFNTGLGPVGQTIDYSGNELLNSANLSVTGSVTWPFDLGRLGILTPIYDFTWTDDIPFDPNRGRGEIDTTGSSDFRPYTIGNTAYVLHNVRLQWEPPGETGLTIAGWCRNVTDERYKSFGVDLSSFASRQLIFVADPRICGADARFTF